MRDNVEITNQSDLEKKIKAIAGKRLKKAVDLIIEETIDQELPEKKASPIAKDLFSRRRGDRVTVYTSSIVWDYLDKGTGIYSKEHQGKGPGGAIVAYKQKRTKDGKFTSEKRGSLHFKNAKIAAALGFKDENVFLRSVKGIKPRFIFDRHFSSRKIAQKLKQVDSGE